MIGESHSTRQVVIAYVPVLHRGYLQFLEKYVASAHEIKILGSELIAEFDQLRKDVRAIPSDDVVVALQALLPEATAKLTVTTPNDLKTVTSTNLKLIMPDEEIMHELAAKYFSNQTVEVARWS